MSERDNSGEKEFHRMVYTGKQGKFQLRFEQYFWVIENLGYILTLTCEEDQFEHYQKTGERILRSFRIK